MNNTELKYMIALVKHNLSLEKKIEILLGRVQIR